MSEYESLIRQHLKSHSFSDEVISRCIQVFETKREKIEDCATPRRLLKYTFWPSGVEAWVMIGTGDQHVLFPPHYCSCDDFYFNSVTRGVQPFCYHLIAQMLGETTRKFTSLHKSDEQYAEYMQELTMETSK